MGLDGIGVIAHGRSNPVAIKNAIRISYDYARTRVDRRVREEVESGADLKQSFGDKVHKVFEQIKEKRMDMEGPEAASSDQGE